jgi:hypothetical protein
MTKIFLSLLVFTVFSLSSCDRKGCTDVDAINHNGKAKSNDNSCRYLGDCIIWFDIDKQVEYTNDTIPVIYCYVEDELIGTIDAFNYTGTPPSCGSPKGLNYVHDLVRKRSDSIEMEVKESDGTLISTHTFTVETNECNAFKIPN